MKDSATKVQCPEAETLRGKEKCCEGAEDRGGDSANKGHLFSKPYNLINSSYSC